MARENMKDSDPVLNMSLHEEIQQATMKTIGFEVDPDKSGKPINIIRVPGGWIYLINGVHTFVPYSGV